MADFCLPCSKRLGLPCPDIVAEYPGSFIYDLCEGCGYGWFDDKGNRVPDSEICPGCNSPKAVCSCKQDSP